MGLSSEGPSRFAQYLNLYGQPVVDAIAAVGEYAHNNPGKTTLIEIAAQGAYYAVAGPAKLLLDQVIDNTVGDLATDAIDVIHGRFSSYYQREGVLEPQAELAASATLFAGMMLVGRVGQGIDVAKGMVKEGVGSNVATSGLAGKFAPDPQRPGTALQIGVKPVITLRKADFTPEEIAWIDYKYRVGEIRALSGAEVSRIGAGVPYQYRLSQKFARDTLAPGVPLKYVQIGKLWPGMNVDEFVSRHLGGRQVFENQNWAPARANQLMGSLEYNAVKDLPKGTPIHGFLIDWK